MKGWKKILVFVLIVSITTTATQANLFLKNKSTNESNDAIVLTYKFDMPTIEELNGESIVKITGCELREKEGEPVIPYKKVSILLPAGKDVKDIKVIYGEPVMLKNNVKLKHGGMPVKFSDALATPIKKENVEIKKLECKEYPDKPYEVVDTGDLRGFKILNMHLYPVKYLPGEGELLYYPEMKIKVETKDGEISPLFRGTEEDYQLVARKVDNPSAVTTYKAANTDALPLALPSGNYQYVIITDASLESAFQQLVDYKSNFITATIVNLTYIQNNYAGEDLAEQIRNFIKDAYLNWGTEYVLLGGDVEIIPCRKFYVKVWTAPPTTGYIPADLYYAGLDGTWNDDGDSYWGELEDNPDWYAEVYVGRAPVNTVTEVDTFIDKVISFETATKPQIVQLHQSRLDRGNDPDSTAVPEACAQWVPAEYTIYRLYEEYETVTHDKWVAAFANGPLIFQHCGHGDDNLYYINYENGGSYVWYNDDVPLLNNTFYPIHISIACYSGAFDYSDCLAEEFIKYANGGASAVIMNSRYGWYSTGDANKYSGEFMQRHFYELFVAGTQNLGKMMQFAKEYYASDAASSDVYRWCYYEINLLGDPETPALTTRSLDVHDVAVVDINAPTWVLQGDLVTIDVTVENQGTYDETFTLTLTDTTDGVTIGTTTVTLAAGASSIESFTWNTTGASIGDHTIKAEASVVEGETDTADNVMTTTITVKEVTVQSMYVWDISWSVTYRGRNPYLYFTVTVKWDSDGDGVAEATDEAVSDATVYATLTHLDSGSSWDFSGTTDANGEVTFGLFKAPSGDYKAEVTDITHSIYIYNSAMDVDNPDYYTL